MRQSIDELFASFEDQTLDPAMFKHRDHLAVAYEVLRRYDFVEASFRYAESIRGIAEKAGAPGKFNVTITLAFLSLIAERMAERSYSDFQAFEAENPDLGSMSVLGRFYTNDRITSETARKLFLLPDRAA